MCIDSISIVRNRLRTIANLARVNLAPRPPHPLCVDSGPPLTRWFRYRVRCGSDEGSPSK